MPTHTAHLSARSILQLLMAEIMTPEEIADGVLILPDAADWLIYMGTRHERPPGHTTIPSEDGSSRLARYMRARMGAAKDDDTLARKGITPNISFVEGLDLCAEAVTLAHEREQLLWYPQGSHCRWFSQLRRDETWWKRLLKFFPDSRLPRNPNRLSVYPTDPTSWARVLELYVGVNTNHMPPQTILGRRKTFFPPTLQWASAK